MICSPYLNHTCCSLRFCLQIRNIPSETIETCCHFTKNKNDSIRKQRVEGMEWVPYSIWFHSTSPIALGLTSEPFLACPWAWNEPWGDSVPGIPFCPPTLFTSLAVNAIASRSKPFLGSKGPLLPNSCLRNYGDRLLSAMALHLVGKSERK